MMRQDITPNCQFAIAEKAKLFRELRAGVKNPSAETGKEVE